MNRKLTLLIFSFILVFTFAKGQALYRHELVIPDINGYKTLKCDFHIHTVFSNGLVWPTVRVQEAWMEGLDAIAFTDHIEYHTFDKDVVYDDNRAVEIAEPTAELYKMIVIRGVEITRSFPLGHFNAIYTSDNNAIRVSDSLKSIAIANQQNAFVFWNHPLEDNGNWSEVQEYLFKQRQFKGIEVANHDTYFPEAQQWCMDKNLTMMANSDVHNPITFDYNFSRGEHRTMTLVFARERSAEGIKEALLNQRTAVYWQDKLIGKEEFLRPIFTQSISAQNNPFTFKKAKRNKAFLFIKNSSDIPFKLVFKFIPGELIFPKTIVLKANSFTAIPLEYKSMEAGEKNIKLLLAVENLLVGPNTQMKSEINFVINVE